jgi:hypothetical protein
VPLDSFVEDIAPLPTEDGVSIGGEIKAGKGAQPTWLRGWVLLLIIWALWYFFIGGQGLFRADHPMNIFFAVVVIAWTVYHYILVPRFKWPALPLG